MRNLLLFVMLLVGSVAYAGTPVAPFDFDTEVHIVNAELVDAISDVHSVTSTTVDDVCGFPVWELEWNSTIGHHITGGSYYDCGDQSIGDIYLWLLAQF